MVAALLLADVAFSTGMYVQGFPEYGPERMGAPITAYNRLSNKQNNWCQKDFLRSTWKVFSKFTDACCYRKSIRCYGWRSFPCRDAEVFRTGEWRMDTPKFIEEKCKQCLLCVPVCPDSSIPVKEGKRLDFDLDHCKGCGICEKACPFDAIIMKKGG